MKKLVVFDVDETLGAFSAFAQFCESVSPHNVSGYLFRHLLDQHPEYLRPHILEILQFVRANRSFGRCYVALYTNNQGPPEWISYIKAYIEEKLGAPLFDYVIRAYKINNIQVEKKRTRHDKCVSDLLACTKLPASTRIFFVDDQFHPDMIKSSVVYFHIKPYEHPNNDDSATRPLLAHLVTFLQG